MSGARLANYGLLIALLAVNALLAQLNRHSRAEMLALSPPPSERVAEALSFGDRQFLYRAFALNLQTTGDGGGRVTPIRNYNFGYIRGWLDTLARLDPTSHHHFFLAVRYFSFTPDRDDLRKMVDFVVAEATKDPATKWYWLTQAMTKAEHDVGDLEFALSISRTLAGYSYPDIPNWIRLFPALLLEKLGRNMEALEVIARARADSLRPLTREEMNWTDEVASRLKSPEGQR